MRATIRSIAVVGALLLAVAGCRTVTGRTAGEWVDDKTTTARVKTAIAGARIASATRVDVDTRDGTVFLAGIVDSEATKRAIEDTARSVANPKPVVSRLELSRAAAASPATAPQQTAMAPGQTAAAPPITSLRFGRMEAESAAAGQRRFAAYDREGKRVATLYVIPASEFARTPAETLDSGERRIDHVSIYPHPGSDGLQYHVVLWHVNRAEASRLQ